MVANEKEAKHQILCSFDPVCELFHNGMKHSPFCFAEWDVVQINYYAHETSAFTRCFSVGKTAVLAYERDSAKWKAEFSAHLCISQE